MCKNKIDGFVNFGQLFAAYFVYTYTVTVIEWRRRMYKKCEYLPFLEMKVGMIWGIFFLFKTAENKSSINHINV